MSAPNFSVYRNARNIYAFCSYQDFEAYCEENADLNDCTSEELMNQDWFYQDWYFNEKLMYLDYLKEVMKETFGNKVDFADSFARVHDGDTVADINDFIVFAGCKVDVCLSVVLEAGYYDGFSLDWKIDRISYGYDFDYVPDEIGCQDILRDDCKLNEGLCVALANKLQKRLDAKVAALGDMISDALEKVAPYCLEGHVMSNGEGIYFPVEKTA